MHALFDKQFLVKNALVHRETYARLDNWTKLMFPYLECVLHKILGTLIYQFWGTLL